jgi:hypothetical protein
MKRPTLAALALVFALATLASAGDNDKTPTRGVASAKDVAANMKALTTKITWQTSLDAAKAIAARDGKLIFWMHILGDLAGST